MVAMGAVPATTQDRSVGRYDNLPGQAYAVVAEVRAKPGKEQELRDATLHVRAWFARRSALADGGVKVMRMEILGNNTAAPR